MSASAYLKLEWSVRNRKEEKSQEIGRTDASNYFIFAQCKFTWGMLDPV
jgi:hypothetical protein